MRLRVAADNLLPAIPWLHRPDARSAAGLLRMMLAPGGEEAGAAEADIAEDAGQLVPHERPDAIVEMLTR